MAIRQAEGSGGFSEALKNLGTGLGALAERVQARLDKEEDRRLEQEWRDKMFRFEQTKHKDQQALEGRKLEIMEDESKSTLEHQKRMFTTAQRQLLESIQARQDARTEAERKAANDRQKNAIDLMKATQSTFKELMDSMGDATTPEAAAALEEIFDVIAWEYGLATDLATKVNATTDPEQIDKAYQDYFAAYSAGPPEADGKPDPAADPKIPGASLVQAMTPSQPSTPSDTAAQAATEANAPVEPPEVPEVPAQAEGLVPTQAQFEQEGAERLRQLGTTVKNAVVGDKKYEKEWAEARKKDPKLTYKAFMYSEYPDQAKIVFPEGQ